MNKLSETDENSGNLSAARLLATLALITTSLAATAIGMLLLLSRHFFISELLNNFRLQIGLASILLGTLVFFYGLRKLAVSQLLVAFIVLLPILSNWWPAQQAPPGPTTISLLTYNVLGTNSQQQPIVELMNSIQADITVIIEYSNRWIEPLAPYKESNLDHLEAPRWHGFGIAVFSQFELQHKKVEMLSKTVSDFPFLLAEVVVDHQRIILAAGHFLAPINPAKMEIRNQQIDSAIRLIDRYRNGRDLPVIVVGDMNAVPWSPFIKDLAYELDLRDSRRGYPYQGSWPNDNNLLRIPIDNSFVSKHIHVHRRELLSCYSSDHLPVMLEFSVTD